MPKAGFIVARFSFLVLAASMLGAAVLAAPAAGQTPGCAPPSGKCFAVSVSPGAGTTPPSSPAVGASTPFAFTITNEATEFQFAKDGSAFPLILDGFHTSYEDNYHPQPLSGIHPSSLIALPFLVELPGVAWVAITEANLDNYAGLYLTRSGRESKSMFAKLAPAFDEPGVAVRATAPMNSPTFRCG